MRGGRVFYCKKSVCLQFTQIRQAYRRELIQPSEVSFSIVVRMPGNGLLDKKRAASLHQGGDLIVERRLRALQLARDDTGEIEQAVGDAFQCAMPNGAREGR